MVDIVKPPCSSIIIHDFIHDFYTYPHLLFVDIKYSHVGKCVKKMNHIGITHFIFMLNT